MNFKIATITLLSAGTLHSATLLSLNSDNSFMATLLDSSISLNRPGQLNGNISITGGFFTAVDSSRDGFETITPTDSISGAIQSSLGGGADLAVGDTFTIESSDGLTEFNAEIVFLSRGNNAGGNLGVIPSEITATSVGAVFDVTTVPEPSSIALLGLASLGMLRRRR